MFMILAGLVAVFGGSYLFFKYKYPWLMADIRWFGFAVKYAKRMEKFKKENILSIDIFEETVDKYDAKPMIIYKEQTFSFAQVEKMANRIANVALDLGLKQGDTVAILMYNEPAFVWTWFGFQKIGVKVAFLNFHQRNKVLLHSINSCETKALFINQGKELYKAIDDIDQSIKGVSFYTFESASKDIPPCFRSLSEELKAAPENRISRDKRSNVTTTSTNCYVFTSGTTGLPKPAIVSNMRSSIAMYLFDYLKSTPDDILYECLPLYHSSGSLIGIGHACAYGVTIVLSEKFSASRFFKECHQHKVTMIHYVGEMCRYLVNSPPGEFDTDHQVRGALGNGLRKDVWNEFQSRFKIKDIVEFYGATELPFGLSNLDNVVGSVGKLTPFRRAVIPGKFIKFDTDKEEPYRESNGRCILARDDEPGLFVVKVDERSTRFDGYKNEEATKRKLMHNVFKEGDLYVNSGDLFYIDADKDVYFYDRLGDTYRWKGENVSTTEVANIISELPFIADTCVYGTTIPGCEGKAGMATVNLIESVEQPTEQMTDQISSVCVSELASYAIPRFIRFKKFLDITSTFKQMKGTVKKEGYDLNIIQDPMFYFNLKSMKYVKLTNDIAKQINSQEIHL